MFASHSSFLRAINIHLYQHVMMFLSDVRDFPTHILVVFGFSFPQITIYIVTPCTCISMQCIIESNCLNIFATLRLA